jgi:hypothetical protein
MDHFNTECQHSEFEIPIKLGNISIQTTEQVLLSPLDVKFHDCDMLNKEQHLSHYFVQFAEKKN